MNNDIKFLVAIDNEYITAKIKDKYGKENVYEYDILSKEDVIEFLGKHRETYIVITKDSLEGNIDNNMYIKQMKFANPNIKIVYIVKELTNEYKQFLFANEVFNIIEEKDLSIENIYESINQDKSVIYKNKPDVINYVEIKENYTIPKKLIAIYGTSGSGKSYVSSVIARNIAKDLKISVALLDMDIQNPAVDIYNNITVNLNGLSNIIDEIDNKKEMNEILDKYMICDRDNKKLWYITNNSTLFDIQNKYTNKYYERIYNSVNLRYDYSIIDLPSSPFLDVVPYTLLNATDIFFVINPNYISIRQAIKYLELITKLWDIPKSKINIIINKKQRNSLEITQIDSLIGGYKIVGEIYMDENMDTYINSSMYNKICNINKNKIYEALNIAHIKNKDKLYNVKRYNILKKKVGLKNVN